MTILNTVHEIRACSRTARIQGLSVGFVPTMGFLHDGHGSLIAAAASLHDVVIASIFVNPTQFGPNEDFERYPRSLDRDVALAKHYGCTHMFVPSVEEMYPVGASTAVSVKGISDTLEGKLRPGHFDGVATVVARLLLAVEPNAAYFGAKDLQQTLVIRSMVRDLGIDCSVCVLPTIREADGLAMSSRNVYLSETDRVQSAVLFRALCRAGDCIKGGERRSEVISKIMQTELRSVASVTIEYAVAARTPDLAIPEHFNAGDEVACLLAVRIGTTRLIDNATFVIGE